ncbi:hypothetical protein FEDK69T_31680 [Flavobacterium enshiense DK69]|uniref:Uncharacterized protein n=1 Tax=Flavobacterium enshiense DK69 TaxID=1107311 RepID=V6RYC9_9FLAO|nr:hypothetical protein [Flavobacterium enshiense]ESU19496.1 hypothetical protein FEDK69T_31680 [Flavobacterium enshiense DK69]KGO92805.1 hypothetical protein Q767_15270 [Flavobacterium enshiense DK69]
MRDKKLKIVLLLFLITLCFGFTIKSNSEQENIFEFSNGKQKVKFEIASGKEYLKLNQTNKVYLHLENVNIEKLNMSGHGLKMVHEKNTKNKLTLEINTSKEFLEDGKWRMIISEMCCEDSLAWYHKFLIPTK